MERKEWHSLGNDLYCDALECNCPNPLFVGSPIDHLMKNKIKLVGYDDDYFFNVVNKEPKKGKCRCGREYKFQWFNDGVEAEWIGEE